MVTQLGDHPVNPLWKKRLLPPMIIGGCGLIAGALISLGGSAEKTPPVVTSMLVETLTVQPEDTTAVVRATGVLEPARQVAIVPQVAGRIVEISDQLMPGGRVAQGDVLAMIEQRDFLAAHAQAQRRSRPNCARSAHSSECSIYPKREKKTRAKCLGPDAHRTTE